MLGSQTMLPRRLRRWLFGLVVECGLPQCRRFHLAHPLLTRLPGIFLHKDWYCSPACLRDAVELHLGHSMQSVPAAIRRTNRMPFRLILLEQGTVSESQVEHARSARETPSEDLGEALVRLGHATEEDVARARAAEAGCGFYSGGGLAEFPADSLPLALMRRHRAVVVHHAPASGRLLLGFAYRPNQELLQAVEAVIGCRAEPCIVTPGFYREQLERYTATQPTSEVRPPGLNLSRSVSAIVQHAISSGAERVQVGLCGADLWARFSGGKAARDLVLCLETDSRDDFGPALHARQDRGAEVGREPASRIMRAGHGMRLPSAPPV